MKQHKIILLVVSLCYLTLGKAENGQDSIYNPSNDYSTLKSIDSSLSLKHYNILNTNNFELPLSDDEDISLSYATNDSLIKVKMEELNEKTPLSLTYNASVKRYINLYVRKKGLVSRVLARSERYFPLFEAELDKYNMPLELKYLAVVESALNPKAVSPAHAVGLWQFIPGTGRMYNLNSSSINEDRIDPYKATEAACKYLYNLHEVFHDWDLALAAYNCGGGNVNRAIRRSHGKTNYWAIINHLPRETRNYVPAFIAINYVMHYAKELGISPNYSSLKYDYSYYMLDTIHVQQDYSFEFLSKILNMPKDALADLNPSYRFGYIPKSTDKKSMVLCLPSDKMGYLLTNREDIFAYQEYRDSTGKAAKKNALKNRLLVHRVRSGENLSVIASRYRCNVRQLKVWNNLRSNRLRIGQQLKIYLNGEQAIARYKRVNKPKPKPKTISSGNFTYHVVQTGDTLWGISKLYKNISVDDLKKLNAGVNFKYLKPGTKIKVKIQS